MQVRSLRLKKECQNAILFPDSVTMKIKMFTICTYKPIHANSSLKFRRDDPFSITPQYLLPKDNIIAITEKRSDKYNQ